MNAIAIAGFVFGLIGTLAARRLAQAVGAVSRPNPIVPQHVRTIAYLGGLGITVGVIVAMFVAPADTLPGCPTMRGLIIGALGFVAFGTVDDLRPFAPLLKLGGQFVIAGLAVLGTAPSLVEFFIGTLWIVVMVNAVNLTDVCDGLVASLASLTLGTVALAYPALAVPAVGLGAATFGFLVFNRAPASIFLGDGGSHLLGFGLAALSLVGAQDQLSPAHLGTIICSSWVFLLELGFLVVVRAKRGLPFWRGSPDHLALRIQARGFSKSRTVGIALAVSGVFQLLALGFARSVGGVVVVTIGAIAITLCAVIALYRREPVPLAGRPREEDR